MSVKELQIPSTSSVKESMMGMGKITDCDEGFRKIFQETALNGAELTPALKSLKGRFSFSALVEGSQKG